VALAGVTVFVTLLPVLVWLNRRYTVTTRRLIVSHGFFVRTRQELLHSRGYDVTLRRGPLQHLHRSGHVTINAGLESPVVLRDVPSAVLVVQALQDLMEENANMVAERRRQEESRRGRPGDAAWRQPDVWPDDTQPWQRG
jgi:membrane protein YdbS with pleckstrin-like domain